MNSSLRASLADASLYHVDQWHDAFTLAGVPDDVLHRAIRDDLFDAVIDCPARFCRARVSAYANEFTLAQYHDDQGTVLSYDLDVPETLRWYRLQISLDLA